MVFNNAIEYYYHQGFLAGYDGAPKKRDPVFKSIQFYKDCIDSFKLGYKHGKMAKSKLPTGKSKRATEV